MMRNRLICLVLLILLVSLPAQGITQKITLKQAIEETIAHNPEILKAGEELKAVNAGFWKTVSPENPGFFTEYEEIPTGRHSLSGYSERKIGLAQEFDFPLAYYYRGQWYNQEIQQADAEYRLLRNEVIVEVKKRFLRVQLLEKKKQLYENSALLTRRLFQQAQIRVESGESAPYDTLRVKIDLAEAENNILAVTKEYETALFSLKLLMGRGKSDTIHLAGELTFSPISLHGDSLKQMAMVHHPVLKKAASSVNQKNIEKKLSYLKFMPNFELSYFRQDFRDVTSPKAWGGEIGFSIPLWSFLMGRGATRAASHEIEAARWQIEVEKRKVLLEVEGAFSVLFVAERHVNNFHQNILREVEELVRIASRSYEEGEMGYLEVTEAYRTRNRTMVRYYDRLFEYCVAQADLEKAVGVPLLGDK
ncbi:TolC family protein [Candidatus Latescibacterota bacterium]